MTEETDKKQSIENDRPWLYKPGQSGNPAGRPKGSISDPLKILAEQIALRKIKLPLKKRKQLGLDKKEVTVLESIALDWALSLNPIKQQMFIERLVGKVPNINLNTNQNVDYVTRYRRKFTDSELEAIASGADALEILISKIPDIDEVIDVDAE